jgi:hypothetical protein
MAKLRPMTRRKRALLDHVYRALETNELQERWIKDAWGVVGLQQPGILTISPGVKARTILHEALHAIRPHAREWNIERSVTALYYAMTDDEARQLTETWDAWAKKLEKPTTSK